MTDMRPMSLATAFYLEALLGSFQSVHFFCQSLQIH